jgi:hypothetical protein
MTALRIEGYVIVSADGMLADAHHLMPPALKFKGDQEFFNAALDDADLIVHGRNSYEDQPNSPQRKRIILTRDVSALARDASNTNAVLWNPAGASFAQACALSGIESGIAAVIGGPIVFGMFMDRYDTFWLSVAPHVRLPGGGPCFPGAPDQSPQDVLTAHGLQAIETRILDPANGVSVTAWRRR